MKYKLRYAKGVLDQLAAALEFYAEHHPETSRTHFLDLVEERFAPCRSHPQIAPIALQREGSSAADNTTLRRVTVWHFALPYRVDTEKRELFIEHIHRERSGAL